jgi:hypothetical protein
MKQVPHEHELVPRISQQHLRTTDRKVKTGKRRTTGKGQADLGIGVEYAVVSILEGDRKHLLGLFLMYSRTERS